MTTRSLRRRINRTLLPGAAVLLALTALALERWLSRELLAPTSNPIAEEDLAIRLFHARLVIGVITAGLFGALALLTRAAVEAGLAPVDQLAEQLLDLGPATLDRRLPEGEAAEELAPVIARVNQLLERLATAFERERLMSSDIAHELRTPIAELRSLADVARRHPGDRKSVRAYFRDVHDVAEQMERVVVGLLTLSRAEAGLARPKLTPIALDRVIEGALDRFDRRAGDGDRDILSTTEDWPVVSADGDKLSLVMTNLIDNAIDYAPQGDTVRIGWDDGLWIENAAPLLTPDDVEHLFDRFWRKDVSRTGDTHSGLGLALVRAMCVVQGIAIQAAIEDGRLRFFLQFPEPLEPKAGASPSAND